MFFKNLMTFLFFIIAMWSITVQSLTPPPSIPASPLPSTTSVPNLTADSDLPDLAPHFTSSKAIPPPFI